MLKATLLNNPKATRENVEVPSPMSFGPRCSGEAECNRADEAFSTDFAASEVPAIDLELRNTSAIISARNIIFMECSLPKADQRPCQGTHSTKIAFLPIL
jgi:hypothetical protein